MPTLYTILLVAAGLVATLLLGLAVKPLLDRAKKSMRLPPPSEGTAAQWAVVTGGTEGGRYLGHLERLLFFCAFLAGAETVVAGWLAFKVASKWNVWTNVVAVPKDLPGIEPLDYLVARRSWGSHVLMTFLLGTLANVLAAYLGVVVARHGHLALKMVSCQ